MAADEIELKTAPADFRFPTTNQTRHCFTRYIEFHRCLAAKGEESNECERFAKYYRSLCPGDWIEKWNEQRENGTFPVFGENLWCNCGTVPQLHPTVGCQWTPSI
ncbi:cytochrome c oxidase subunit 6b-2 [Citrus sinensis]|nr:cytochrome c oxidase subunit 6b-2 [Citrus sinensis]